MDDSKAHKPLNSEADAMVEVSTAGYEASNPTNVVDSHMDCSPVLKVRTLHISSSILDGKSMFFYKLFSNEMRESQQTLVTLRIDAYAAKQYLVARFKDITRHQEELMELPLVGIVALLSSYELQVGS
ncbi:unnamed protein product [Vicia faba]|uniref:Uncharacterized protein n=1 Tax=Vicia faba TaxID=3906 RepID=A0AAV1AZD5_VICFA|nr:unnamed protein product [Vicia faba]